MKYETILFISSIITSLATITLAILTARYVLLTKKISNTNLQYLKESIRPYVSVKLHVEDQKIQLEVKNIGTRSAFAFEVNFIPSLDFIIHENIYKKIGYDHKRLLNYPILVPQQVEKIFLNFSPLYFENEEKKEYEDKLIKATVHYRDGDSKTYSDKFSFFVKDLLYEHKFSTFSDQFYLKGIEEKLDKVHEAFKNLISEIKFLHSK